MAEDVLEHHDRVVHQHAHTQGQAAETHDVERDACEIQQSERSDHGDGNRQSDRHGIARIPEEEEEHEERQRPTDEQCLHDTGDGVRYEPRLAHRHVQLDLRILGTQLCQHFVHSLARPHRVGAGFLEQQQSDRIPAVVAGDGLSLFESVAYHGHVAETHDGAHRRCVARTPRQRDRCDFIDRLELADRPQGIAIPPAANRTARRACVRSVDGGEDLADLDVIGLQQTRIHLNVNLTLEATYDRRLSNPVDLLQAALEHLLSQILERPQIVPAGDADGDDRLGGRIGAQHDGPVGQLGKLIPNVVQLLPHVEDGEVHVGPPREAQRDEGDPLARHALHALDAGHGTHSLLDPLREESLDLTRRDVGIPGVYHQPRIRDVGQQIDWQPLEGNRPQESDGHKQHRHRNGALDRTTGKGHRPSLLRPRPWDPLAYLLIEGNERIGEIQLSVHQIPLRLGNVVNVALQIDERDGAESVLLLRQLQASAIQISRTGLYLKHRESVLEIDEGASHLLLDSEPSFPRVLLSLIHGDPRRRCRLRHAEPLKDWQGNAEAEIETVTGVGVEIEKR